MSRIIKFRAWTGKKMGEPFDPMDPEFMSSGGTFPEFTEFMQYTGRKDKNGKEIYEGDICRVLYTDWGSKSDNDPRSIEQYIHDISKVCIVEFIDYEWAFNFGPNRYGEIGYGSFHVGAHGYVELVGNKFENPDLINPT